MRAQMVIGSFQYEPCDLQVENYALHVKCRNTGRALHVSVLSEAALIHSQKELSMPEKQYEFLVEDEGQAKESIAALMKRTVGSKIR